MILIDSGVSVNDNVGDNRILEYTINKLKKFDRVKWIRADFSLDLASWFRIVKGVVQCRMLYVCCGGLFKHEGWTFILRKLIVVNLTRLFRKKVVVDSQTVYLKGIWRILFKISFKNITVPCRDKFSLQECKFLGIETKFKHDVLYNPKPICLHHYFVTTRYHPAIFHLNRGIPVIAVYWNEYYRRKFSGLENVVMVDIR